MVGRAQFEAAARLAAKNIIRHGDTDIFPLPFENHAFFDRTEELVTLIGEYDENFESYLAKFPPTNVSALTPVSYYGFRWATQIDPIWNAHLLSCVLAIGNKVEEARISTHDNCVFSYRYKPESISGDLFDRSVGWHQFMQTSIEKSHNFQYVITCDISEFYPRIGHHRLENALQQIAGDTGVPSKIMSFLSNFSNTRSFGLPIGGPAARILSELTINQIDRLLTGERINFVRFADDFHLFANSREEAYHLTIFLSEKLFENQGLSLQKSKTRIMTSAEFRATNPLGDANQDTELEIQGKQAAEAHERSRKLLRFSLRFDPYSPTAKDDYEKLRNEIKKFDIISLLKEELSKSRIHIALSRKIVSAIKFLDESTRDSAVLSIIENSDLLYPIFSSVLIMIESVYEDLNSDTKIEVTSKIIELIRTNSHIFRVDVLLCFALRVLQHTHNQETQQLLQELYRTRTSEIVRRDIILIMAHWGDWYWLSDLKNRYRQLSAPEKRAFIAASYSLRDEGRHWRDHMKNELNPFEQFILQWSGDRANQNKGSFYL